jgi:transcriptional regulator with XRE-family HTH domain
MTTTLTVGERIAWHRRRRGMSQEVLASLVGRTPDWLSKIENGHIHLDRISVLRGLARALDVSLGDLLAEPSLLQWTADSGRSTVPALRSVLMDYRQALTLNEPPAVDPVSLDQLRVDINDVWDAYQSSRFGYVTHRLVELIPKAIDAAGAYSNDDARLASGRLALAYQVAATTLTKLGESDLAWSAAHRGMDAAHRSGNPVIITSVSRAMTHSLLSTGAYAEAVELTHHAVAAVEPDLHKPSKTLLSVYGAQLLAGSMAAARNQDRDTTHEFLAAADHAARRLGYDGNRLWTAFGHTNVAIHRVSTSMELGDVQVAVDLGPTLDTSAVPTERRVRHALEVSRALSSTNHRDEALRTVLEAEQLAPEQVRYHFLSRHLVQTWVRSQRGKPGHHLTSLAQRLGVA